LASHIQTCTCLVKILPCSYSWECTFHQ
jgi:hypothetical protein